MARRHSMKLKRHRSRRVHGGRTRRVKHSRRRHGSRRMRGGNCAAPSAGGAACNAGSSSNYAVTMVGDAFIQMKQALASAFA